MPQPFEILTHTADLKIRVHGDTLEGLFRHALQGMFESISPTWKEAPEVRREIKIKSSDQNALLVDFLSEAVGLSDIHNEAYTDIKITELTETSLKGALVGKPVERFAIEIKAVTYHGLDVHKKDGGWEVEIVFDV